MKALLAANASPNEFWYPDKDPQQAKRMPLILAAQNGREEVVCTLIHANADVNASREGRSVLMHACHYGYENTAQRLLDAQANINATNGSRGDCQPFAAAGLARVMPKQTHSALALL